MDWSKLIATQAFQSKIRSQLLGLSGVTTGRRFGGEAFFFRKRFFCHFHPSKDYFFLETFVWVNVNEVVRDVPGVIPHPEYGGGRVGHLCPPQEKKQGQEARTE